MRVLLDTNVLLDVLLRRDPWVVASSAVWQAHDEGQIAGQTIACAIADVFYVAHRLTMLETARTAAHICLEAFVICKVDHQILEQAQALPGSDFEDNLQIAFASLANLDATVTRDKKGFRVARMPVLTPAELLVRLG